ncbi:MAG: hypothetical protein Solumvirus6_18 [Solumvirus sp.]|uniref:Uncharacterized protein n=1 Tax=Solumvirus sp. TaxID=2487773 RepID=A0A3G5AJW8_9VIRU|nr:MAG: hypothetical protein Solumvirus6_18 [Solumvirus sp.]
MRDTFIESRKTDQQKLDNLSSRIASSGSKDLSFDATQLRNTFTDYDWRILCENPCVGLLEKKKAIKEFLLRVPLNNQIKILIQPKIVIKVVK